MKAFSFALVAAGLFALASPASADDPNRLSIENVPPSTHPANVPAGLKVTCVPNPNNGAQAGECPVVHYKGITTWAYSYLDNRVSLALVSYDATGKVVATVEKPGTRYVWNATSDDATQTVMFFGQSSTHVTASYASLAGGQ
ncbi:MAG: hypothetical protein WDM91_03350 [Rhizomicrobium sp.]